MRENEVSDVINNPLLYGSLFSGIGGFDLGFDRAGMKCAWQVEIDPFARRVLEKHWPEVPKHDDVRTFEPTPVDVVCAGFPCQDISSNNQYKRGIEGEKSSLFHQVIRIICEIRPRVVALENVSDLLVRGMDTVLGELASSGFDGWWDCVPAAIAGIPQRRWRTFIVAYASGSGLESRDKWITGRQGSFEWNNHDRLGEAERRAKDGSRFLGRVDDGIPRRVDRLRCLGNSICPQISEWIGRRIIESI